MSYETAIAKMKSQEAKWAWESQQIVEAIDEALVDGPQKLDSLRNRVRFVLFDRGLKDPPVEHVISYLLSQYEIGISDQLNVYSSKPVNVPELESAS